MRDYRAYILGIEGHRFIKAKEFLNDHPDDATALSAAKRLLDGHEVEVWDCGRLVARFSADGEIASPELVPLMVSNAPSEESSPASFSDGGHSDKPPELVPLSQVSEAAGAVSNENHLLLGW